MKNYCINISTPSHQALVHITDKVREGVKNLGLVDGVVHLFVLHTTCGLTINENADPAVVDDLLRRLETLVPWHDPRDHHREGNSAAHLRSSLFGPSLTIPVEKEKLVLGTWQGVFLAEFDGPRTRQIVMSALKP